MFRASRTLGFLAVAGLGLAACQDDDGLTPPDPQAAEVPVGPAAAQRGWLTYDEQMVAIEREVPGFAGVHFDSDTDELVVHMTPAGGQGRSIGRRLDDARSRLRTVFGPTVANTPIRDVPADYTFSELRGWYDKVVPNISGGIATVSDVDEMRNRIVIGVMNLSDEGTVRSAFENAGVPSKAVIVEERAPMSISVGRPAVRDHFTGVFDPRIPGIQIGFLDNSRNDYFVCTMGLHVKRIIGSGNSTDGRRYFITNAHCAEAFGGFGVKTGLRMGQPDIRDNWIATEYRDPPLFDHDDDSNCPEDRECRYADAAVFKYHSDVAWHGRKLIWDGLYPLPPSAMPVDGILRPLAQGAEVHKTGRTTGGTEGEVTAVCQDIQQFDEDRDTGRTMLCQVEANYESDGGDSGSPVFLPHGDPEIDAVIVAGIHWGGEGNRAAFSPTVSVLNEVSGGTYDRQYPFYSPIHGF